MLMDKRSYKILRKLDSHINDRRWGSGIDNETFILSDDFFSQCKYDKRIVSAILRQLRDEGIIDDTYVRSGTAVHTARITEKGILELKFRRRNRVSIVITAIITFLGYDFLRDILSYILQRE